MLFSNGRGARMTLAVASALLVVYVVWGTTYLAIRIAIETLPPFLMVGVRFLLAGGTLYGVLRLRGVPRPTRSQWQSATLVGLLMWVVGNGGLTYAEQWIPSGLSAVVIASVPLWAALFAGLWGDWPRRTEWGGLILGAAGVAVLSLGDDLRANPIAALVLVIAAASFALGSVWSHRLPIPGGLMGTATVMLSAGMVLVLISAASGERFVRSPSGKSLLAMGYLIVFGALLAASAYGFLLQHVRPALATSYAFVNPLIALIVGHLAAGERISVGEVTATVAILIAVGLVMVGRRGEATPDSESTLAFPSRSRARSSCGSTGPPEAARSDARARRA